MGTIIRESPSLGRSATKYEQLCIKLIADVQAGRLKAGDALPPEPEFAEQLNVARSTVRQAFAHLERQDVDQRLALRLRRGER